MSSLVVIAVSNHNRPDTVMQISLVAQLLLRTMLLKIHRSIDEHDVQVPAISVFIRRSQYSPSHDKLNISVVILSDRHDELTLS